MTTSVFRSQGCLHGGLPVPDRDASGATSPPSPPPPPPPAVKPHSKNLPPPFAARHERPPRRSHARPPPLRPRRMLPQPMRDGGDDAWPRRALVMEEVKILKRGEDLNPAVTVLPVDAAPVVAESVFCQMFPLGPDPDSLPRSFAFIDLAMDYSQPVVVSPSPSSLPFPNFSMKKPSLLT